jgi:uncharacterized Zn-finger protein
VALQAHLAMLLASRYIMAMARCPKYLGAVECRRKVIPGLPWSSQHKTTTSSSLKPEYAEPIPAPFQSSYHPSSTSSSIPLPSSVPPHHRIGQFNDEYQRPYPPPSRIPYQSPQHHPYEGQPRASSSGYRYEYHQREESAMSPGSPRSVMQGENSLSPRTSQGQFVQDDSHAQEMESIVNGKRPRSAPRVMSTQPRIFACTQCPARFARNHDLKRHQRGHLSVRPYPCQWCGKSFSRKDALKRHILVKVSYDEGQQFESSQREEYSC